ncbi:MAG: FAD-binding protein [Deltaproteobacteria bacterium HGW-Deltaproteobacteria-15]|jgi:succinate dehydrogenase/fumarate reductase flavoprotein subunit|nr:MAG: FAD-binding protein [Deltaproteobacteria bacterium HGW-Deltaproteobacteria-15]
MQKNNDSIDALRTIETDVLILGSGAAGCGAAIAARQKGLRVLLLDKGKLESSGCLGGGNDHFMAVLNSGPETDTADAVVKFYNTPVSGFSPRLIADGWVKVMPAMIDVLLEIGVKFATNEDGSWLRTVGFGQPGNWWINIENGATVKRRLAKKIRSIGVDVQDHIMITRLLTGDGRIAGCVGYDVLDGAFYVFRAKKVILALGNTATRGWTNSSGNPYNVWFSPYNTGGQFVLPYEAGARLMNIDTQQLATLIPKGFGAPGMNGINSMGGHELNALGERFMGKYDPMLENGLRVNQIAGTYQELVEGKGPPFYMDMRHLSKEDVQHLQYVLMPGDKATYNDYSEQRGLDFATKPMEVELSELCFSGLVRTRDNFETDVPGLFNGCVFFAFSGSMCGGYSAGLNAAEACLKTSDLAPIDSEEVLKEKERILRPLHTGEGMTYLEFENAIRQVMNYYMGYRRNQKGMEIAFEKLTFLESRLEDLKAEDYRQLMRANESMELLKMCKVTTRASMERKESGRACYRRTDYPNLDRDLAKPLLTWEENGEQKFAWGKEG